MIKFDCGCIGLAGKDSRRLHFIIQACDGDRGESPWTFSWRTMEDVEEGEHVPQKFEPLPHEEVKEIWNAAAELIRDGEKFQELKRLLK